MCGLAGILGPEVASGDVGATLTRMLARLRHRGPDGEGVWIQAPMALGHRRLAVVDLRPTGHQPMVSANGQWVLAFNGEIYNHHALRTRLSQSGVQFRGTSDTEVLLAMIQAQGLEAALRDSVGMFALALWDSHTQTLHLARDRIGEKPLYVGRAGASVVFGSELKALMAHPGVSRRLSASDVHDVIANGYVRPSRSILSDVVQVPPGGIMRFGMRDGVVVDGTSTTYWTPNKIDKRHQAAPSLGLQDALTELDAHLRSAVAMQLQADVPVGVFLSGGIDSSLVSALAVAASNQPVRSYTIGFDDPKLNESAHARAVAAHLGTQHTEFIVGVAEARDLIPHLSDIYDEPLADASQIPTVFLARLARRDVTVALSGDGADEVFAGYPKYQAGQRLWSTRGRVWRAALSSSAMAIARPLQAMTPSQLDLHIPWHKLHAASSLYGASTPLSLATAVAALNRQPRRYLAPALLELLPSCAMPTEPKGESTGYLRTAMLADLQHYLPADILCKVDRATMSASLESRAPMLDHRLVEWASGLPPSMLTNDHQGKLLLRQLLYRYVPRPLVDRPKAGFVVPLGAWLKGELRPWAYDMLRTTAARDVINVAESVALLDRHCLGNHDFSARLWPLITLASWAHRYLGDEQARDHG
jgi:asparagine synthase (glutamine-hydrolysing)